MQADAVSQAPGEPAAVARSEARLRRVLQAAGAAYWEVDLQTGELFASESCASVFGNAFSDLDGWLALTAPEDARDFERAWQAHLSGRLPQLRLERRTLVGEERRWLFESAHVFERDAEGRPLLVAGSAVDITHRKQMEERVLQGTRLESLGRMAGGVAHDFNNLLTVILSGTELARIAIDATHPTQDDLANVIDAALRARRLTDQLLAFARHQVVSSRVLSPRHEIEALFPVLDRLVGGHIALHLNMAPDIWMIRLHPSQFEQVLVNLAVNAADAMPTGGRLTIEVENVEIDATTSEAQPGLEQGSHVRVTVTDTGVGMSEEVSARIFEPFFSTKSRGRGTGLGLATVYGVAQQSGGHVSVSSAPGRGTSFFVYFPLCSDEATPSPHTRDP